MNTENCSQPDYELNGVKANAPLSEQEIMELCEAVAVIQELTFGLREDIDKHIQKDNPDRGNIDFRIEQIYDLAFTASMHEHILMYPS